MLTFEWETKVGTICIVGKMPGDRFQKNGHETVFMVSYIVNKISRNYGHQKVQAKYGKGKRGSIFSDEQYSVSGHEKLLQSGPLTHGYGFLMINKG